MAKKSKFDDLDSDFKLKMESASEEEIRATIAKTAMDEHKNQELKKEDLHLKEKQAEAKEAGEQYAEATKMNRLRIAYAYAILDAKGKV